MEMKYNRGEPGGKEGGLGLNQIVHIDSNTGFIRLSVTVDLLEDIQSR
jgi:hypothetical protein